MRQEAEPAGDDVTEVAPGVLRMQLPISMPGLGHVNTYVLEDDRGVALVDPGVPGDASWDALLSRLKQAGIPLARVHTAVITHSHFDHFGGAGRLAEEAGAEVLTHAKFTTFGDDIVCTDPSHDHGDPSEFPNRERRDRTPWGTPSHMPTAEDMKKFGGTRGAWTPHVTRRVRHGDVVSFAGREWVVHHTPGHTVDHVCFHDPVEGVLLSADHVLPSITPHIGGELESDPLAEIFASLNAMAALEDVTVVLPAHGHPFDDLAGRAKSIHDHHIERLEKLQGICDRLDWATVPAISQELFAE